MVILQATTGVFKRFWLEELSLLARSFNFDLDLFTDGGRFETDRTREWMTIAKGSTHRRRDLCRKVDQLTEMIVDK